MSNELVRKNLETSLQFNSLSDLAKATETIMLLIDTSSSMCGQPIEDLRKVVTNINPKASGLPMIAFGGPYDAQCRFVDTVPEPDGGTPLHIAIPMAKEYGANRVVVISDGCPDLREQCIIEAKNFGGKIDVVYIGAPGDGGEVFLRHLATLTGGTCSTGDIAATKEITDKVILMLNGEVDPAAKIIIASADGEVTVSDIDAPDVDDDNSDSDEAEMEFEEDWDEEVDEEGTDDDD